MKDLEVVVVEAIVNIFQSDIDGEDVNSVDLRDVHAALGSKSHYGDWVKNRIEGFVEGVDYSRVNKTMKCIDINGLEGYKKELKVVATLDTAKSIAMIERNAQGKALRQYFIDFEKNARVAPQFEVPTTLGDALIHAGKVALEKDARATPQVVSTTDYIRAVEALIVTLHAKKLKDPLEL